MVGVALRRVGRRLPACNPPIRRRPHSVPCVGASGSYNGPYVDLRQGLHPSYRHGINFFDTADIYSLGASEEILGGRFATSLARPGSS
jgi:hypothetical protein